MVLILCLMLLLNLHTSQDSLNIMFVIIPAGGQSHGYVLYHEISQKQITKINLLISMNSKKLNLLKSDLDF